MIARPAPPARDAGSEATPSVRPRVRPAVSVSVVSVLAVLMLAGVPPSTHPQRWATAPAFAPELRSFASVGYNTSLVSYRSSVDGFSLSYYETRPYPFNASRSYPLAIELHGLTGETVPVAGGTGGGVVPATAQAAVSDGFILLDLNTRTGSGWYVNSNYTGPQEQDVLDAIVHERLARHIGSVYLFGVSMGSIGTFTVGLDHPKWFAGLGAIASFTDFFEMYAYLNQSAYASLTSYMVLPSGGQLPNASAYARGIFYHLSPLRFHPENASGLRVYVANGAQDVLASNNASLWPYQQENATLVNRSCLTTAVYAEPANCTTPLDALAALHPARYHYRYVFEPNGPHAYYLLNPVDMFAYFLGNRTDGTYWGTYPLPTPYPPPSPLITVAARPAGCGAVTIGGIAVTAGETRAFAVGNLSVTVSACGALSTWTLKWSGGASYDRHTRIVTLTQSAALVVAYRDPAQPRRGAGTRAPIRNGPRPT